MQAGIKYRSNLLNQYIIVYVRLLKKFAKISATRAPICKSLRSPRNRFCQPMWPGGQVRVVVQRPARLGIDSWAPWQVYKFGLSKPWKEEQNWVRTAGMRCRTVATHWFIQPKNSLHTPPPLRKIKIHGGRGGEA